MQNEDLVREMQLAIKKDYGEDVTLEEAEEILQGLTDLFSTLGKIYSRMEKSDKRVKN